MRALKIVSIVVGILLILVGLGLLLPGGFLLWAHQTQTDGSGFFETSSRAVATDSYALTTPEVTVHVGSEWADWLPEGAAGTVRLRVESDGENIFVGIGPADEVDAYLANVAHDQMIDFSTSGDQIRYRSVDGGAPSTPPADQDFWVVSASGSEVETLEWEVVDGEWTAVIMNADASAGIEAQASIGAQFDILFPIAIGLLVAGFVALAIGILLVVLGARRSRPDAAAQAAYPGAYPPPGYPPTGYQGQQYPPQQYPPQQQGPVRYAPSEYPPAQGAGAQPTGEQTPLSTGQMPAEQPPADSSSAITAPPQ